MSKVIKSSRITGEYRIDDKKIVREKPAPEPAQEKNDTTDDQILEMSKKAGEIIEQAKKEAEEILKNSREEAAELLEQARENAYQDGYQKGFASGKQEAEGQVRIKAGDLLQTLETAILKLKEELDMESKRLSVEVVKLAVDIASRIINVKLEFNPELINNIILEMLQDITHVEEVSITVSPEVMNYINLESLKDGLTGNKLRIIEDSNLKIADCIVKTELGGRDGTLENKLDLLEKELLKEVGYHEGT